MTPNVDVQPPPQPLEETKPCWSSIFVNGSLYNVLSDEHAQGLLWMAVPLVVVGVYEHCFYIDYHNRKAEYVEKFMDHIDWVEVNAPCRIASAKCARWNPPFVACKLCSL